MTTTGLELVSLGAARALTRDGGGTEYLEMNIRNGKFPSLG
ncbi:MAG: hypothetical protein Q8R45_08305 [Brevundimonas sp.]|nr:hypothetical protein [Brevundimonas sp.]MDP3656949.1 hypothetical protein [Brevundimonas sp.]MDZ4111417.1 hypothetical protein [Brevundimonas sp.]